MAYTSLKVRAEDKRTLDRLMHEYALQTGEEVSQHEFVRRLLAFAQASKKEFMRNGKRRKRDHRQFFLSLPLASAAAHDIDRVVYELDR